MPVKIKNHEIEKMRWTKFMRVCCNIMSDANHVLIRPPTLPGNYHCHCGRL